MVVTSGALLSTGDGRRKKLGRFLVWSVKARRMTLNWFQREKKETKNLVKGYFAGEFLAICNHCGVMAAWRICCVFWKNDPYGKIFKILFRKFSSRHRSTCCVQIFRNLAWLADGKSVKSCVVYLTKKSPGSPAVVIVRITPKICQSQPRQCVQSAPDFIEIGSFSAGL